MKLFGTLLAICAISIISCNKAEQKDSITSRKVTHAAQPSSVAYLNGGGAGLALQLHRTNGTKKGTIWNGRACDCTYCFGLCTGIMIADGGDMSLANTIVMDLDNGTAELYILEQPDDDVQVDPTFFVDNDVTISDGTGSITILQGEYPYDNTSGNILFNGESFSYYGTVIVDFQ